MSSQVSYPEAFEKLAGLRRTSTPEAAIKSICIQVLREAGINSPPVSLKPLLKKMNIKFSWTKDYHLPGIGAASTVAKDGDVKILIHEKDFKTNWRRTRFSIAHEIMHVLIWKVLGDSQLIDSLGEKESFKFYERICDIGAAELLMPSSWIRKSVDKHGLGPSALMEIYDEYLVSEQALLRKFADVVPRGAVFVWKNYRRSENEKLCLRIYRAYPGYEGDGVRPWLPNAATEKHLEVSVPEEVFRHGIPKIFSDMKIFLGKKKWMTSGVCTHFTKREEKGLPLFEDHKVKDDIDIRKEIIMFLAVDNNFFVHKSKLQGGKI